MRVIILFCVFLLTSITSCKEGMDGVCDSPFKIEVGKPTTEDGYKVYLVSVRNNNNWWLSSVSVNGEMGANNWRDYAGKDEFIIENEKYIFEKIDNRSIKIKLKETESDELPKLQVSLQSGNCFGGFVLN